MDRDSLIKRYGSPDTLTNDTIINLYKDTKHLPLTTAAEYLQIITGTTKTIEILRTTMTRIYKKSVSLRRGKLTDFKNMPFRIQNENIMSTESTAAIEERPTSPIREISPASPINTTQDILSPLVGFQEEYFTPPITRHLSKEPTSSKFIGRLNRAQYLAHRKENYIIKLNRKIVTLKEKIANLEARSSHCSPKNVKKREQRDNSTRKVLRIERAELKGTVDKQNIEIRKWQEEVGMLRLEIDEIKRKNVMLKKRGKKKDKAMKDVKGKLVRNQKLVQYHKNKRKERNEEDVMEKEDNMDEDVIETKKNGEFTEEVRLCVMDLAGLEVATGKIRDVMETVGKLCRISFSDLPCKKTCQNIVDEGHYLAKAYIGDRMASADGWGLHKDGTTRRKVKILDTSVCTNKGETFCLGWSSVNSETGKAIAEECQEKLREVGEASGGKEEIMKDLLEKMRYTMNDRAANEKKSNQILETWRDECLRNYEIDNHSSIEQFFCAAHVLLGFHSYTIKALKKLD